MATDTTHLHTQAHAHARSTSMTPPASSDGDKSCSRPVPEGQDQDIEMTSAEPGQDGRGNKHSNGVEEEKDDDGEEILPDHYFEGGKIPVFKPTMEQFHDFARFVRKIDHYGMQSGIVKIIPPKEWLDALQPLDEAVKSIRAKNPIMQEFHGSHGTYTQANIEKQRSYNLPQWKALCDSSDHQPPARRGERRKNNEKSARAGAGSRRGSTTTVNGSKEKQQQQAQGSSQSQSQQQSGSKADGPPTPVSPLSKAEGGKGEVSDNEALPSPKKPRGRQPKSGTARRRTNHADDHHHDEEAFRDFNYRLESVSDYTLPRCAELEKVYWKSLMYNNPMYGADMPGSLFPESITSWNVSKLPNLLDVIGQKVPGVNTAYLYLGMWKATFAWHLEDVDLYSINYIHFGAPKQWYSISQEDAPRFEAAMRSLWPSDARKCDQFLRHKTYLISPAHLKSQFGIDVNRLVHYEGEFVITYPYGYHSGYNLGYNCAESVNFATEKWLDYGRVAKKCNCVPDSVWIDVNEIERKLRGENTPDPEDLYSYDSEDAGSVASDLLTPPRSVQEKAQTAGTGKRVVKRRKLNKDTPATGQTPRGRRSKIRAATPKSAPCVLCPNDFDYEELLPTDLPAPDTTTTTDPPRAHRRCAEYIAETSIVPSSTTGHPTVTGINRIPKARLGLKCLYCRSLRGACFQCAHPKCTRAYHPTCALLAGVQVEEGEVCVVAEDGREYRVPSFDFRCKYHRQKKGSGLVTPREDGLGNGGAGWAGTGTVKPGDFVQFQADREIGGAQVVENRGGEERLLVRVLPKGDVIEIPYAFLLVVRKSSFSPLSPGIKPLPSHLACSLNTKKEITPAIPMHGAPFADSSDTTTTNAAHANSGSTLRSSDPGSAPTTLQWGEFNSAVPARSNCCNNAAVVDLFKPECIWYYLGKTSTECRAQYTDHPAKPYHNPRSHFLESVKSRPSSNPATATAAPCRGQTSNPKEVCYPPRRACPAPQVAAVPALPPANHFQSSSVSAGQAVDAVSKMPGCKAEWPPAETQSVQSVTTRFHAQPPASSQREEEQTQAPWGKNLSKDLAKARELVESITDHANQRAGYVMVDPGFAAQCLVGTVGNPVPSDGLEKLATFMSESRVVRRDGADGESRSLPLDMRAEEVLHLLRMLRFAVSNVDASPKQAARKRSSTQSPFTLSPKPVSPVKYAYLEIQERDRPPVYQSPYAPGFGFSEYAKEAYGLPEKMDPTPKRSSAVNFFESLSAEDKQRIINACGKDVIQPMHQRTTSLPTDFPPHDHDNDSDNEIEHPHPHSSPVDVPASHFDDVESALDGFSNQHMPNSFEMPFRVDSPASSFGRPPLHEYSLPEPDFPGLMTGADGGSRGHPHHFQDAPHEFFSSSSDNNAGQRFWHRGMNLNWDGEPPEHRPLFGPQERPGGGGAGNAGGANCVGGENNYAASTSSVDMVKGAGSLTSVDMNGFSFDDDGLCNVSLSP